jgi:ketosteroid isomerase-like protein
MAPGLPKAIAAYVEGSNAHDAEGCALWFTDDAVLRGEGREMRGVAAVREWMRTAIAKYQHSLEVVSSRTEGDGTVVTCRVSGDFPGSPVVLQHTFILTSERISRLEIRS